MTKRFLAFLSMLCCLGLASATAVFAQDVTPDPDDVELPGQDIPRERRAQTGFKFLSVSPDARAAGGMGDAFSAMKAGSIAMFYNPATMAYLDRKVHLAAGKAHLETGLTIVSHTSGSTDAAVEQAAMLEKMGVHPSAWVWAHAQHVKDSADLPPVARAGAWIGLDGIGDKTIMHHLDVLRHMRRFGMLHRVLLSHDGNSFRYGNRPFKPYNAIFDQFIPLMQKANFTDGDIHQLTVKNPREAFAIRVRKTATAEASG